LLGTAFKHKTLLDFSHNAQVGKEPISDRLHIPYQMCKFGVRRKFNNLVEVTSNHIVSLFHFKLSFIQFFIL